MGAMTYSSIIATTSRIGVIIAATAEPANSLATDKRFFNKAMMSKFYWTESSLAWTVTAKTTNMQRAR